MMVSCIFIPPILSFSDLQFDYKTSDATNMSKSVGLTKNLCRIGIFFKKHGYFGANATYMGHSAACIFAGCVDFAERVQYNESIKTNRWQNETN